MWATRYGKLTGLRFRHVPPAGTRTRWRRGCGQQLRQRVEPDSQGVALTPARRLALEASRGATDFGEYFTYFSFFIVVSALLLVVLFFRLGIEQRLRQIGVLRATGYTERHLRWMLSAEARGDRARRRRWSVSPARSPTRPSSCYGLKTWWVGAVGTTLLELHVTTRASLIGFAGGMIASLLCVVLSLRAVSRRSPRALLGAHSIEQPAGVDPEAGAAQRAARALCRVAGLALMALGFVRPRRRPAPSSAPAPHC